MPVRQIYDFFIPASNQKCNEKYIHQKSEDAEFLNR